MFCWKKWIYYEVWCCIISAAKSPDWLSWSAKILIKTATKTLAQILATKEGCCLWENVECYLNKKTFSNCQFGVWKVGWVHIESTPFHCKSWNKYICIKIFGKHLKKKLHTEVKNYFYNYCYKAYFDIWNTFYYYVQNDSHWIWAFWLHHL